MEDEYDFKSFSHAEKIAISKQYPHEFYHVLSGDFKVCHHCYEDETICKAQFFCKNCKYWNNVDLSLETWFCQSCGSKGKKHSSADQLICKKNPAFVEKQIDDFIQEHILEDQTNIVLDLFIAVDNSPSLKRGDSWA